MIRQSMFINKVYAASVDNPSGITSLQDIADMIGSKVMPIIYSIVGVALFGFYVYAGFTWLMAAGDPDKLKKAQQTLLHATIGTAIVIFAYFATRVVAGVLGFSLI
ncbi:MAG: hypothetical protein U9Q67_02895 [Patescibacteria group bacterium]|nr:hypothetical protein [Patescibacteria group bacterium]